MKNLMIAVCAIAFAAVSQAAVSFNWYNNDAIPGVTSGRMYLIDADALYGESGSQVALTAQVFLNAVLEDASSYSTLVTTYGINAADVYDEYGSFENPAIGTIKQDYIVVMTEPEGYSANTYRNFYEVMMDGDNLYISDSKNNVMIKGTGDTKIDFAAGGSTTPITTGIYTGAGWYQTVPEPTSGLLLLLGVAGLALRRRRA